ncbi:MAG: amidohydrolase family protein [Pseudobdellovibrionaceae bacterium]|nr:amidohydrolase family protein [Pseudobdellovibrionaceae bacterium]
MRINPIVALLSLLSTSSLGARTFIHAKHLIDGRSTRMQENMTLIVDGTRIEAVEKGFMAPGSGDTLIDLKNSTIMPGFMDMHVHLSSEFSKKSYLERYTLNTADYALQAAVHAERTLKAGFTTVRDLGDTDNVTLALRRFIDAGQWPGPRIWAATKSIATTGGHADPTNGARRGMLPEPTPEMGVINGPDEARKAVRQRYKDGADLIKITATGGVLSAAKSGQNAQFTPDELNAIISTAKDYGMTVAAHAHGADGMKRAVLAGVDSIEHGTYMNDEIMQLMKSRGTFFVPTLEAGQWVTEKAKIQDFFPEIVRVKAIAIGPKIMDTFARALKAGVRIAFGTDTGVSEHGRNAEEFGLMVKAGYAPMEAIRSATWYAAQLLKAEDRLGSLEKGKLADIVAVDGDPLQNIALLTQVSFVMKDGKVMKHEPAAARLSER